MGDLDAFARLAERIEQLERRVAVLECPRAAKPEESATPVPASRIVQPAPREDSGAFPVFGKAMLGIAGAYLLRAVAESGAVPKLVVVGLALAYAAAWLIGSARLRAEARLATAVYAITSALILAPMLSELTLRFAFLSAWESAFVLVAYAVFAQALAWMRRAAVIVWIANLAAALTALVLLVATREVVPFAFALMVVALPSEVAACRGRCPALRFSVEVAADAAMGVVLFIYWRPEAVPSDYATLNSSVLLTLGWSLIAICGAGLVVRTMIARKTITLLEAAQIVIAFLVAALAAWRFGGSSGPGLLGVFCLLAAAGSYAAAFLVFDHQCEQRNYHVFATWAAALLVAGLSLCLAPLPLALCFSVAAIAGTLLGIRFSHLTLEFHGLVYLAAAAYVSGLLGYAGRALAGTFPAVPGWMVWMAAAAAVACYAVGSRSGDIPAGQRAAQLASAVLAVAAVITFLVSVLVWLSALGMTPGASMVAIIRTLITCGVALALAFGGSRWRRAELVWIAYGALALVTAKLLLEDLRQGHPASTAVSLVLYAVALILIPRVIRMAQRA